MSRLKFKLYDTEAELIYSERDSSATLELDFCEEITGFVRIGDFAERLGNGKCSFDLRLIENGEYTPELVLSNSLVRMPVIKKFGNLVECLDCTDDYIRAASQRERTTRKEVEALKEKIKLLEDKVFGTVVL